MAASNLVASSGGGFLRSKLNSTETKKALKIFEELGSGSFGKVYRAFDSSLNKVVAIKMIELDTSGDINDILMELRFLTELKSPQITQYYYSSLHDSVLFVMMEYCEVGSCMYLLRQYGVFREESAAYVIHEVLKGLQYIHDQHKIHRDLKSANILVNRNSEVKIADFGVSAQLSNTLPDRNSFMGTPYWMAPEIIESEQYNMSVDIWSLGIVAFELVTGTPPHRQLQPNEAMFRIVRSSPPQLSPNAQKGATVSKPFCDLVNSCLVKEASKRPSCTELLTGRYLRTRGNPPNDFKAMVHRVTRLKDEKYKRYSPRCLDDIDKLAPAKSKNSRIEAVVRANKADGTFFDLTDHENNMNSSLAMFHMEDMGAAATPGPAERSPPSGLPALKIQRSSSENIKVLQTPKVPVRARPANFPQPAAHISPRAASALHPADPHCTKANSPSPRPAKTDIMNIWIKRALTRVESRTKVPRAVARINQLQREIENINDSFPGFTRALIEELWRIISDNHIPQKFTQ